MILFPNCACCCEPCCRIRTYTYHDSEPPGKFWDECPRAGVCDPERGPPGDCADVALEGFIIERFCKSVVGTNEIRAKLISGSTLDDWGEIAGIETNQDCGILGVIDGDHDITDEIEIITDPDDDAIWLCKVPFTANNARLGGPYGLAGVKICWCCKDPEQEDECPCCAGVEPPPPPPPPYCLCSFPQNSSYINFEAPSGQCAVNWPGGDIAAWAQSKDFTQALPDGVFWQAGAQDFLSGPNDSQGRWSFVIDAVFVTCCCPIPVEQGSTLSYIKFRRRVRLLAIICAEDEQPEYVDWTHLIGGELDTEVSNEPIPPNWVECQGPADCYPWPPYLGLDPPVCEQEFP